MALRGWLAEDGRKPMMTTVMLVVVLAIGVIAVFELLDS
jgi:hypothetical protein